MISQPPEESIIDYASPMKRSPLRLAEKSILRILTSDEKATIVETLAGKTTAVAAMCFTGTTLFLFTQTIFGMKRLLHREPAWIIVYAAFICAALLLALKIVDSTWRNTMLEVRAGELTLDLKSPFRVKCYFWQLEQIQHLMIARFPDPITGRAMNELQIVLASGQLVKLFAGHDYPDLSDILALLQKHLRVQPVAEAKIARGAGPDSQNAPS